MSADACALPWLFLGAVWPKKGQFLRVALTATASGPGRSSNRVAEQATRRTRWLIEGPAAPSMDARVPRITLPPNTSWVRVEQPARI